MRQIAVTGALIVATAGSSPAQSDAMPPRPAKVFTVSSTETVERRTYPAVVLPSREVELSFRVSGRVVELPIRGATPVKEGDLIARLDPRDFRSEINRLEGQVGQATAQLDALRAGARIEEVAALQAGVQAAEAQLDQAREELARTQQLFDREIVAVARLESAQAEFRVAEANLQAQLEQLRIGQSGGRPEELAAAEASVRGLQAQLQAARDALEDATLRAPFDGIIARRNIENFTNIQAGASVALLQALNIVHLAFDVPGPDVTALTRNGVENIKNTAVFDALGDRVIDAETVEFTLQADAATQTYRSRVSVTVPEGAVILPGMVARVTVIAPGKQARLTVPLSAVAAASDGHPVVWIVGENGSVASRPVQLGEAFGDAVEIADGLEAGETIVAAGVSQMMDGLQIRPITQVGD